MTLRLCTGLPSLRDSATLRMLGERFWAGGDRFGLRLVHYSVQTNHIHLLVEAQGEASLSRGLQGLAVRIAKGLNKFWKRKGTVFADRYHARILRTPREVRHALVYVLNNARKHGIPLEGLDPFASGSAFEGWDQMTRARQPATPAPPVRRARTWLLGISWRRQAPIDSAEIPGRRPAPRRVLASRRGVD